ARLHTVAGVRHAAEAVVVPLSGADWNGQIVKAGGVQDGEVHFTAAGIEYFGVMGTALLTGRTFERQDRAGGPRAAVVNEAFTRRYFPDGGPRRPAFQTDCR